MMNADLPKIWNTTFPTTTTPRKISFQLLDNGVQNRADASTQFLYPDGKPLLPGFVPERIFFGLRDLNEEYRAKTPDWFKIMGGLDVISEKFRNCLAEYDLGANEFFEVPLYEFDQKTRRSGRWFIFHICETKDTLVAEQSTGLEQDGIAGGFWRSRVGEDVLAARASSAQGADLWIDLHLGGRIFLSDRLKTALKPAGIRADGLTVRPCVVVQ
jgi:hypothetical protein